MKVSKDAWVLTVLFIMLVIGGIYVAHPGPQKQSDISTTYNASPKGIKAFYVLLNERLGYNTERLLKPYTYMPGNARVLIVVQPLDMVIDGAVFGKGNKITERERDALMKWIKKGGTAIFLADDLRNVPAAFGSNQQIGKGFVYAFNSRNSITNSGMHNYHNAVDLINLIDKHARKTDLILFDEYHHGLRASEKPETLLSVMLNVAGPNIKFAAGIIIVAGIALLFAKARRFGAVRRLPSKETTRPGYEFVESIARLYRRAKGTDVTAIILRESFKHALCTKLGLPGDASLEDILRGFGADVDDEISKQISNVLVPAKGLKAGQRISEQELMNIAVEISRLERELGLGRYYA